MPHGKPHLPKLNRVSGTPGPRTPPKLNRVSGTPKSRTLPKRTKQNGTPTTTTTEKTSALEKFAKKHQKALLAIEKIGEGASALDPLTDSGNRPGSTGSPLGDRGADINPYTVVRGESDILSAKERKRLKSLNA